MYIEGSSSDQYFLLGSLSDTEEGLEQDSRSDNGETDASLVVITR